MTRNSVAKTVDAVTFNSGPAVVIDSRLIALEYVVGCPLREMPSYHTR
jgi:hypothetical protein